MQQRGEHMEADKKDLSEVYKELRKFTGAQDLDKWLADNSKAMLEEVKALIKRAVQEGQEAAIKYDSPRLLQRLLDKAKTKEQIKHEKAYDEYIKGIQRKFKGLYIICVLQAILPKKTLPTYEQATDAAIDEAGKLIKEIHKATGCTSDTMLFLSILLIQNIVNGTHFIYFEKEHNTFISDLLKIHRKEEEVSQKITTPYKDQKNDEYYKELNLLKEEMNKLADAFMQAIYKADKAERIAADIVRELYPEQKISPTETPPGKQQFNIPALITKIPEDRVMANTKLSNVMDRQPSLFDDILEIRVSRETDKKPIYTQVQLVYENTDIEIQNGQNNFSPFDRAVHDSVVSIYASGQKTFTPETVYRAMTGKKESKYADPKTIAEVSASIEKSLRIRASIDITKEAEARGYDLSDNPKIKEGTRATMSDTLLSARKLQLRTGGTVKTGYIFNATPILYDYALLSKQIISVKSYLLDVSSAINMTNEVMVIRDYLHREIEIMKNPKSGRNAKIAYKSIYEYLNITPEHHANINNKRLKIRNTVKKILEYQTSKKYIKGWTEYKIGKELGGVIIDY